MIFCRTKISLNAFRQLQCLPNETLSYFHPTVASGMYDSNIPHSKNYTRGMVKSFRRNEFWDCSGGKAILMIG